MKNLQKTIESLLQKFVDDGTERGLQVAVYFKGELVVDAAAGTADPASGAAVNSDTLFPIFSTTKGMAATLAHLLVERGQIGYDTKIAEVWPEFAARGKGGITLRHALNHTSGLPLMPMNIDHTDLGDWKKMCEAIAELAPVSQPGMEYAYHAMTYSWLVGEVCCRVAGRPFRQLLHDEINAPLGLENSLFVGIPDEVEERVALLEANPVDPATLPDPAQPNAVPALVQPLHEWMNRPDARRACVPGSSGIMTALAIAKHYAALLPGGVDGVELLPPERIRIALEPQRPGNSKPEDPLPGHRLGYSIQPFFSPTAFGHGGFGGSNGFADPACSIALAFARNRFVSEASLPAIVEEVKKALPS